MYRHIIFLRPDTPSNAPGHYVTEQAKGSHHEGEDNRMSCEDSLLAAINCNLPANSEKTLQRQIPHAGNFFLEEQLLPDK